MSDGIIKINLIRNEYGGYSEGVVGLSPCLAGSRSPLLLCRPHPRASPLRRTPTLFYSLQRRRSPVYYCYCLAASSNESEMKVRQETRKEEMKKGGKFVKRSASCADCGIVPEWGLLTRR